MGKILEDFISTKQEKIQSTNNYILLLQIGVTLVSVVLQFLAQVDLLGVWFARLGFMPVFYMLNTNKRLSQGCIIFQVGTFYLMLAKLTAQQYGNMHMLLYCHLTLNMMIVYITFTARQTIIGIILTAIIWGGSVLISGELARGSFIEVLSYFAGVLAMSAIARKIKKDEYLAFKYQQQLKKINEMQTESLLFSPDGILVIDQQGEVLLANDTIKRVLQKESGTHEEISKLLHDMKTEYGDSVLDALWNEDVVNIGKTEWVSKRRIKDNQLIISTRDVKHFLDDLEQQRQLTSIAKQEAELAERERLLEQAEYQSSLQLLEQERQHREFMNQFLRFCSHEFKTPTNSLIAFLDIARNRTDLDPETKESLSIAHVSSKQILYLATNLIDYSCLVAQQFSVNKTIGELKDVLTECEFMIKMLAQQKGLNFHIYLSPDCPLSVYTDSNRLKQILLNLLGNSVKFTKQGTVSLHIQPSVEGHLNFMVNDTGVGIKEEDIPELFNQFTMLGDRSLNPNGSGFGLYISNLLLKSLGAEKIEVQSKYGFGSKFYFDLPIVAEYLVPLDMQIILSEESNEDFVPDDSSSFQGSVSSEVSRPPFSPVNSITFRTLSDVTEFHTQPTDFSKLTKILIVDDTTLNRMVLTRIFQQEGEFIIFDAASGQQAIETIIDCDSDSACQNFDLVIMDIDMPSMNGWEATERLIQLKEQGTIKRLCPIIAHTAFSSQQDIDHCWNSGMNYILPKPATREEIRTMFAQIFPNTTTDISDTTTQT